MKLIDKDALVAVIEKRFDEYSSSILKHYDACTEARVSELGKLLVFLNTLEVKEVEEPNASDMGIVEEIILSLKQVENDYHIDHTKEMEWLRNKVKKGE